MLVVTGIITLVWSLPLPEKWETIWCILLWAVLSLGALVTKMIAFSNDKVTRVYPIYYFESVYCLLLDVWVYDVEFNWMQFMGIGLIFCMFFWQMIYAFREKD